MGRPPSLATPEITGFESEFSPFSPSKKFKKLALNSARPAGVRSSPRLAAMAPSWDEGASTSTGAPRGRGLAPSVAFTAHRVAAIYKLLELHTEMGPKAQLSFSAVLKKEFPLANEAELAEMLEIASRKQASIRKAKRITAAAWTSDEKSMLYSLFLAFDVDGSGTISASEMSEIARLAGIKRSMLSAAFERAVTKGGKKTPRTPGGTGELSLPQFLKMVEQLDEGSLAKIKAILPGVRPAGSDKLLVFDDGKQQLWRLVPGGRSLVRKKPI